MEDFPEECSVFGRPLSLARYHEDFQSVVGLASSALQGIYSMVLSGNVAMVTLSSTKSWDHCLMDIVVTFSGVSSFPFFIREKNSGE